jgi:hypothetical protein
MTKVQRTIVLTCSIISFIGFALWFYSTGGYEPAIGIIASIGGFASLGFPRWRNNYKKSRLSGRVRFDYSNNDGMYIIGKDDLQFETKWSKASDTSIHLYNDPPSISGVAIAREIYRIKDVKNASIFDMSSRVRTLQENEIAILKNNHGNYAAIKICDIKDNTRNDDIDELTFDYIINPRGITDFS